MKPYFLSRLSLLGLFLLLVFSSRSGLGQVVAPDSSRISYEEEESDQSDFNLKVRYNYLIRSHIEESQLWKLGLNDVGFYSGRFHYGMYLIYERKLGTSFSVLGELNPTAQPGWRTSYNPVTQMSYYDYTHYLELGAQVAGRYYYNLKQRIRKGKSANNFSANYLSAHIRTTAVYIPENIQSHRYGYPDANRYNVKAPNLSMRYGMQRRLGRYGFVDGNLGLGANLLFLSQYRRYYSNIELVPVGEFRIGLALGK